MRRTQSCAIAILMIGILIQGYLNYRMCIASASGCLRSVEGWTYARLKSFGLDNNSRVTIVILKTQPRPGVVEYVRTRKLRTNRLPHTELLVADNHGSLSSIRVQPRSWGFIRRS